MVDNSIIKIGPVGNKNNGNPFDYKGCSQIVQIFISHDDIIHSIQFLYADENGNLVLSDSHGTSNGSKFDDVKLNHPAEYITQISGYTSNNINICSIGLRTNHRSYGLFGRCTKIELLFIFDLGEDCQFGGFHGTADVVVNSIGVYLKPVKTLGSSR